VPIQAGVSSALKLKSSFLYKLLLLIMMMYGKQDAGSPHNDLGLETMSSFFFLSSRSHCLISNATHKLINNEW
jgi:hypothetical protein